MKIFIKKTISDLLTALSVSIHLLQTMVMGFTLLCTAMTLSAQSVDGFNPGVVGDVYSCARQQDGKVLIGGAFTSVGGLARNKLARLNEDGTVDAFFDPNVNGNVRCIAVQADGKILVGGEFTSAGRQDLFYSSCRNFMRLSADGTVDLTFLPNASGMVRGVAIQPDGKILIVGNFGSIAGDPYYYGATGAKGIARLNANGTPDTSFVFPNSDSAAVSSIALHEDGKFVVGGSFTAPYGSPQNKILRFNNDGTQDYSFGPIANSAVRSLAIQSDGKILIGGDFTNIQISGGGVRNRIARLKTDGTMDTGFNPNADGAVSSFALQADGKILVGGSFGMIGGVTRNKVARLNVDGTLDADFNPNITGTSVSGLTLQPDGTVFVAGMFTGVGLSARSNLARLFNNTGALQSLVVSDANQIDWIRGGSAAEIDHVVFESWTGSNWINQGSALRVAGGWRLSGLTLPASTWVRSRGNVSGGEGNGSSGIVSQYGSYGTALFPDISVREATGEDLLSGSNVDFGARDWRAATESKTFIITNKGAADLSGLGLSVSDGTPVHFESSSLETVSLAPGESTTITITFSPKAPGIWRSRLSILSNDPDETPFFLPLGGAGLSLDVSFSPLVSGGDIKSFANQADGKIIVGGDFTAIGGVTRGRLARLNADGTLDPFFNPNVNGWVKSIAVQTDGKILLAGDFNTVGGVARAGIARVNIDGTLDSNFAPTQNGIVSSLVIQTDGRIVVGGTFSTVGTATRNRIARLNVDGNLDGTFNPNADNYVAGLSVQADGKIFAWGTFNTMGGTPKARLARLNSDGTLDTGFNQSSVYSVNCLVPLADGKILIGGYSPKMIRLNGDGTTDAGFTSPSIGSEVRTIAVQADGKIVIGGFLTTVGGQSRNGIARLNASGSLDLSFDANINNMVNSLAIQSDGSILAIGGFNTVGGVPRTSIVRLLNPPPASTSIAVTGATQIDWLRGGSAPEMTQTTFDFWNGSAWVGQWAGVPVAGGWRVNEASLPSTSWIRVRGRFASSSYYSSSGIFEQILSYGSGILPEIVVKNANGVDLSSGSSSLIFSEQNWLTTSTAKTITIINAGGATLSGLALGVSGANQGDFTATDLGDTSLAPGANTTFTVTFSPKGGGKRLGLLSLTSNDLDENPFAINLEGTGLSPEATFNPVIGGGSVVGIGVQEDGKIVIGGRFTSVAGIARSYLARLHLDGSVDASFNSIVVGNVINAVIIQPDGKIVIGGSFSSINGIARNGLARLNLDGSLDTAFNPNASEVNGLALQTDGKLIICGYFTTVGGVPRNYIARINSDGTLDNAFNPNANSTVSYAYVSCVALQSDGKIVIGGDFGQMCGVARRGIARINSNGTLDSGFDPNPNSSVSGISLQADGKILICGSFTSIGAVPRNYIARLTSTGALDAGFNPSPDVGLYYSVSNVLSQTDGKIIISGSFTSINGVSRNHLARLNTDGTVDTSLFDPEFAVYNIAIQADGKILIAGNNFIDRIPNNIPAIRTLSVPSTSQVTWLRGGGAPEVEQVTFDSWNGSSWVSQGSATRIAGGWSKNGLSLPASGWIRAQGRATGGACNRSSSVIPQVVAYGSGSLPEIAVEQPSGTEISSGGSYDYGIVATGGSSVKNFTVRNAGSGNLTFSTPTITGPNSSDFALTFSGTNISLAAGAEKTFSVTFSPSADETRAAILQIISNDADETPFNLVLRGSRSPQVIDTQPSSLSVYEGDSATLSVSAVGAGPLSYQWFAGNSGNTSSPIGTNSANLQTANLLATSSFWVRIIGPTSSIDSATATVTVNPRTPVFTSSANPSGPDGDLFTFHLQATLGPLTFSSADLPNWLSLDPSTGWLTGTPLATGSWDFNVQASNSFRSSNASLHLVITPPKPIITSADTANGRVNDPFSLQITATQNPTTYGAADLPSGLTVDMATGFISGTPLAYGAFAVPLTAVNAGGTGQQTLNLVIQPPIPPPFITSPPFAATTANVPFSYQLTASNSPQSFSIQNGPAWLGVNSATGLLSGTAIIPGNVVVQVRATNTTGPGSWTLLSIYIAPNPSAPVVTSLAEARGRKNDPFTFPLTASPAATSYAIAGSLPAGIVINASSGLLSGTPSVEGTFNVTVTASNASGQSVATPLRIVLGPARLVPVISSVASLVANVGVSFSTTVLASNSPTSFTFENLPVGLLQSGTTGQISGTLTTPGTFSFSVKASNADGDSPVQQMSLRVQYDPNAPNVLAFAGGSAATASAVAVMQNPLDFPGQGPVGPNGLPPVPIQPPVIIPPPVGFNPNQGPSGYISAPFSYQVLADKPATLFTATGLPTGLTIAPATGMIGGTPTTSGSFEVTLQASNASGAGEPRLMVFKIDSKPDTPEIIGSLQEETFALAAFTYRIQTKSILPITSYTVTGLPDGLNANTVTGQISGAATVTGTFEVKLRASSAVGAGAQKTLYLLVRAGPLVPKITSSASVSVQQGAALNYQITSTNPPMQGFQASGLPDGVSLNATNGLISGKPVVSGTYQVTLRASNVNGASDPMTLQIQVKPNAAVPVMLMPSYLYFDSVNPINMPCMASNLPANLPWDAGIGIFAESVPSGMTLNSSTGILSGYPSNGATFTIRLYGVNSSGRGPSASLQFVRDSGTNQPVITGPLQLSATMGSILSFTMTTDRPASSFIFRWGGSNGSGGNSGSGPSFAIPASELPLPGTSLYSLEASNGAWGDRGGLSLRVAPASGTPIIQTASAIYCTAGVAISPSLAASGSPTRFEVTAMSPFWPSGLNFDATTGAFSGAVSQSGAISFLARAYNATGPGLTKEITMVFSPPSGAPAISTGVTPTFAARGTSAVTPLEVMVMPPAPLIGKVGELFSHQFQASGDVVRFSITGLPEGLVYNENTGEVSGEPVIPGQFDLIVTPMGTSVSGQPVIVSLLIDAADGTPVMTSLPNSVAVAGTAFACQFAASENPSGYNLKTLPDWLVFNPFTGSLSGTPNGPGDTKLQISAFNSLGQSNIQDFTISIAAAVGTPVMTTPADDFTGRVGEAFNAMVAAPGTVSFFDGTVLPYGISLNSQTGMLSGIPVESGTHEVKVWGVNAQGTGRSIIVTFVISPATGTPTFVGDLVIRILEGQSIQHSFATSPTATLYAIDGLPAGWSFDSSNGLLQATPLAGIYNHSIEAWNSVGSSGKLPIQIRVFTNPGDLWKDNEFGVLAADPTISAWDADPDHDGLVNLLERAFNLNPNQSTLPILVPITGTSGLPLVSTTQDPSGPVLSIQYIRLKASTNPRLSYAPQFSSTLEEAAWSAATGTETVKSIDDNWERVTVADTIPSPPSTRFGRVKVVAVP